MDFCDKDAFGRVLDLCSRQSYFQAHCDIRITALGPEGGEGEMAISPALMNVNGTVHGGALYTLADSLGGSTAFAWGLAATGLPLERFGCTTVSSSMNYLRPARGTKLTARSFCRKMGKTLSVVDVSLFDDGGSEVCCGTFTFYYIDKSRYLK